MTYHADYTDAGFQMANLSNSFIPKEESNIVGYLCMFCFNDYLSLSTFLFIFLLCILRVSK